MITNDVIVLFTVSLGCTRDIGWPVHTYLEKVFGMSFTKFTPESLHTAESITTFLLL